MSYTNDLTNLANIASVVTSGITSNGTAITKISVGNSTVNSIVNSTGIYVNGSVIYQTTAGLSANVLVLTSNAATYLGNSSGTLANIQNYITGNAATAYTNAIAYSANANNISSGTITPARLGSGTANSTTILYGNSVFAAAPDSTNASALISGTVNVSLLASYGTANSTTILYGNSVWAAPPEAPVAGGNTIVTTGNGSNQSITLSSNTIVANDIIVTFNGLRQTPNSYIVTTGTLYVTAPANSDVVVQLAGGPTGATGATGAAGVGITANATAISAISVGNSTVNTTINSTALAIGSNTATFGTAVYHVANGNVGIGTNTPSNTLSVTGTVGISGSLTSGQLILAAQAPEGGQISFLNPDNSTTGLVVDVSTAHVGRIFQTANNSNLQLGQLAGSGGVITLYTAASERMRIEANGNVGIGTSSPAYPLNLQNTNTGATGLYRTVVARTGDQVNFYRTSLIYNDSTSASGTFPAYSSGLYYEKSASFGASGGLVLATSASNGPVIIGTSDTERMRITSAGLVGIGTASPTATLQVANASGDSLITSGSTYPLTIYTNNGSADSAIYWKATAGSLRFGTTTDGITTSGFTEAVRISSNGNVGIGTSTPGTKLNVYSASAVHTIIRTQNTLGYIDIGPLSDGSVYGGYAAPAVGTGFTVGTSTSSYWRVLTNGAEALRIDSAGNVGIGTSLPAGKLQVVPAGLGQFIVAYNGTSVNYTDVDTNIFRSAAGVERMRIDSAGLVGIGTASPATLLDVNGTAHILTSLAVGPDATSFTPSGLNAIPNYGVGYITTDAITTLTSWGAITAYTAQTERFRITQGGLVGIGTNSPSSKLSVGGNPPTAGAIAAVGASGGISLALSDNVNNSLYVKHVSGGAATIGTDSGGQLALATNGFTERMRIDSAGNVGIGTSAPGSQFENVGQTRLGANVAQGSPSTTDILSTAHTALSGYGANYLTIGQYGAGTGYAQWIQSSFSNPTTAKYNLILQPLGGNVGIGTASPTNTLDVTGTLRVSGAVTFTTALTTANGGTGTTTGSLANCTADGTNAVGFLTIPQNAQTGSYTLVLADSGKSIFHATGAGVATYTIPANGSVAYVIGTTVTFINMSTSAVTISITTDTLYLGGTGTTGSRTLAQYGVATATKMTSTTWIISGAGLT